MMFQSHEPGPPAPQAPVMLQRATARNDLLRLGEVADLKGVPAGLRSSSAAIIVARRPSGATASRLDARRVCHRAHALMPALAAFLDCGSVRGDLAVTWTGTPPSEPVAKAPCAELVRPVKAGEAVQASDLKTSDCTARSGAFRYDPVSRLARAGRDLPAGATVRPPPPTALAEVQADQPLYLISRVGPVAVERRVRALRAAGPGAQVIVRTDDGATFPAPRPAP